MPRLEVWFRWVKGPYAPLLIALLAVVLGAPALWSGLLADDFSHRDILLGKTGASPFSMFVLDDGNPDHMRAKQEKGYGWWALPEVKRAFMRPVSALTHMLDYALWPDSPLLMHVQNLLWLAACVIVLGVFYRQFLGVGWPAGIATLIFAIDDSHAMPIFWIANRNALIGAFFYIACLLFHHRWRQSGDKVSAVLAHGSLLISLLAVEGALGACAYLFAYALFIDRAPRARRLMTLVPYAIIAVGWQLVYRGLGYGEWGSQALADPGADPVQFLTSVALFNPFLLFAQLAGVGADIYMFLPPLGIALGWGIAILFLACLAFVMKPELQLDPRARFFALGMVLSIIPSCTIFPADRLLLPSSVGAAGLLALFFARVNTEKEMPKHVPSRRRIERLFYYGLIFVHLVMAPLSLPVKIYIQAQIFQLIEAPIQDDSQTVLEGKTVITLDDVTMIGTTRLHDRRVWDGADIPAQTYAIAPMSLGPMPIRYTRLDETTLSVEFLKPYSWIFWRDLRHPFAPGDQVKLERLRVEIVRVDSRGVPTEITLSFDVPLEDPAYVWLEYKDLVPWPFSPPHFVPITPPPIGESITLNE